MDLHRFIEAQAGMYETALAEIRRGSKQHHWMWFIFPQIQGLGTSQLNRHYAIRDLAEAIAYLNHAVLGPRLIECSETLLRLNSPVIEIFGSVDALKLRSCMTLFEHAAEPRSVFTQVIETLFQEGRDPRTLEILGSQRS